MERCGQCGVKLRDGGHATPLGELRCQSCADVVNGAALGLMSGGGLGGAIAGPGILGWVRRTLHPRSRRQAEPEPTKAEEPRG